MTELYKREDGSRDSQRINSGNPLPVAERRQAVFVAMAHESLAVANSAVGFVSDALRLAPDLAVVTTDPDGLYRLRVRVDGRAPTTTSGHIVAPGDVIEIEGAADIEAARFISTNSATSAMTMAITFYRREWVSMP